VGSVISEADALNILLRLEAKDSLEHIINDYPQLSIA
jgi:uncharacterized protein (DUF433 family)